jgi:hypothetical protein
MCTCVCVCVCVCVYVYEDTGLYLNISIIYADSMIMKTRGCISIYLNYLCRFQRASVHSKLYLNEDTGRAEIKLSVPEDKAPEKIRLLVSVV